MKKSDAVDRIFSNRVKTACWEKAPPVPGRDPDRWRLDAFGNPVCKRLTSCEGCLCHEYDHIVPYSQGGASTVDNCQILQTRINRLKADRQLTAEQLKSFACEIRFSERELDLIEMAVYGNVQRDNFRCRCKSFFEVFRETTIPTGTNNR
ncbi:hypothetical protein GAYE_PCTG36G0983 [Galdieria yellowstonensis]|uniref:HNH domain-containing protein n=1 Tax=Galdieria yellowstonensis TaxID=3028027 RepID=A0AAV9I7M1_9RHOD|nr:hypothetical protein GAYE_PCTG36G0983 [Galdieria yellowstonensis]